MGRRSRQGDPKELTERIAALLPAVDRALGADDLRAQMRALVPIGYAIRDLGSSVMPRSEDSAKKRLLFYLRQYLRTPIASDELRVVAGIDDWARRVRELRVENGWQILSGASLDEMDPEDSTAILTEIGVDRLDSEEYVLLLAEPDEDAAAHWRSANRIRRMNLSILDKLLLFLRENVGQPVTGEQLRYVAGDRQTEWARRTRELRTELGWPVATKTSGRPDLPVGVYLLEEDRQSPEHDRSIPDPVRREVLRRDGYRCQRCGWSHADWNPSDPRHLEAHHVRPHVVGGSNEALNLITLCRTCHDIAHSAGIGNSRFMAAEAPLGTDEAVRCPTEVVDCSDTTEDQTEGPDARQLHD